MNIKAMANLNGRWEDVTVVQFCNGAGGNDTFAVVVTSEGVVRWVNTSYSSLRIRMQDGADGKPEIMRG